MVPTHHTALSQKYFFDNHLSMTVIKFFKMVKSV
jgi:hypothetical protein